MTANGRVFKAEVKSRDLTFTEVEELKGIQINQIYGIYRLCFAVSVDGRVFTFIEKYLYSNHGLGKDAPEKINEFIEVKSLSQYKIIAAYAGFQHSLFLTNEGKVLACGKNDRGQMMLAVKQSDDIYYMPIETIVTNGAKSCIVGSNLSVVLDCDIPPNNPNQKIK